MPVTHSELQARELQFLAPYAQKSAESRGRVHPENPPTWRTDPTDPHHGSGGHQPEHRPGPTPQ